MTELNAEYPENAIGKLTETISQILAAGDVVNISINGETKLEYTCPLTKKANVDIQLKGIEADENNEDVLF